MPVPGAGKGAGNLTVGGNSLSVGSLCSSGFDNSGLSCVGVNSCRQLGIGQVLGTWQDPDAEVCQHCPGQCCAPVTSLHMQAGLVVLLC